MEMIAHVTVRGAKFWVGQLDSGKSADTGTVYVDVELRGQDAKGICTQALRCESSEVVKSILGNPFPFLAEVSMVETSNGKDGGAVKVATKIVPLKRIEEGKKAA